MIVLLTDFGLKDEYVGVMKGVIYSLTPNTRIIDLTHEIPPQDIIWASIVLYKSYKYFPQGSIFLTVVDPGVGTNRDILILKADRYYFVAPDNGVLTSIYTNLKPDVIVKVDKEKYSLKPISSTFHGRDIFAPLAAYLKREKRPRKFGREVPRIKIIKFPKPIFRKKEIQATIIHEDRFGNLIVNLEKEEFEKLKWRRVKIFIRGKVIRGIASSYSGEGLIAIWESHNLLEIALPRKSAGRALNVGVGEKVRIVKYES